jgi:outer membrane lipoprotein-sorting protein
LRLSGETYRPVTQYRFEAEGTGRGADGKVSHVHMKISFKSPDKYRIEGAMPGMMQDIPVGDEVPMVDDGAAVWFYFPGANRYWSIPASALTTDRGDSRDLMPESVDGFILGRFRHAADFASGSRFLREETIDAGGSKVDCYVLSVPDKSYPSDFTWWIDSKRFLVLRLDNAQESSVMTNVRLGDPIPDNLFRFQPPPGAANIMPER